MSSFIFKIYEYPDNPGSMQLRLIVEAASYQEAEKLFLDQHRVDKSGCITRGKYAYWWTELCGDF